MKMWLVTFEDDYDHTTEVIGIGATPLAAKEVAMKDIAEVDRGGLIGDWAMDGDGNWWLDIGMNGWVAGYSVTGLEVQQ